MVLDIWVIFERVVGLIVYERVVFVGFRLLKILLVIDLILQIRCLLMWKSN